MLGKGDKRRGHPTLAIAVGALAVIGAFSIVNSGKRWVTDKAQRMAGFVCGTVKKKSDALDFCD